jgi:AraC-like DNA-binding protein
MKLTLEQYRLNHQRMARVMHYLEANLDADLRLETLAEVAHLSRFHFDRFYKAKVRESPIATVRRLRLKRAYRMLEECSAKPIHELAGYSGYGSVAAFSRAFTRSFGHAPTDIRDARSTSSTILAADASRTVSAFSVLSLPAIPMAYQPFSGPAAQAEKAYDEFGWRIADTHGWRRTCAAAVRPICAIYIDP